MKGAKRKSISTFDKLYTTAASSVTLNLADTWNKTMRVGGVAGHMAKEADGVFKQAQNNGAVTVTGGKSGNTNKCFIGGICEGEQRERTFNVKLDFLGEGEFNLTAFKDGINADIQAMHYNKIEKKVNKNSTIEIKMVKNV